MRKQTIIYAQSLVYNLKRSALTNKSREPFVCCDVSERDGYMYRNNNKTPYYSRSALLQLYANWLHHNKNAVISFYVVVFSEYDGTHTLHCCVA